MKIPEYYDGFTITITDLFGSGDKVAMQGFYEGVYKPTGKRFKANAAHIWTVKDGKITHFFQAVDTQLLLIRKNYLISTLPVDIRAGKIFTGGALNIHADIVSLRE